MSTHREDTILQCYQIPGQCWPVELGWLYDTFSQSKSHVEIGTYCGKSLFASCAAMQPRSKVVSVDNRTSGWKMINTEWVAAVHAATMKLLTNVELIDLNQHSADAARFCHSQGMLFDSIYIDGCHQYAECRADIEVWSTMLKPGGIISGHDYWPTNPGVMEAVNETLGDQYQVVPGTRIWWKKKE